MFHKSSKQVCVMFLLGGVFYSVTQIIKSQRQTQRLKLKIRKGEQYATGEIV